ncbi:D-3-phosphoglycerate dehydrogenase-like, partial [Fopius arisanus]|uniref:D-3-phosphoglycerate dehydrogenase-like n=1 Tax=Fopius arisanus TaxID=64838 RepID=A0A9R1T9S4_9HYME
AEAQQRVAVEIAEQFLAISGITDKYTVTGIVNAPILSAAMSSDNGAWIELSKRLGQLAARFLKKNVKAQIESQTVGTGMQNKKFIHTAVLVGVLSGQTQNGLNLINAPTLAKDIGIDLKEAHFDGDGDMVAVRIGQHLLKGTVRNNEALLLSIDDAIFNNGIVLRDFISLYHANGPQDLATIVNAFSSKDIGINSLYANGVWLAIETNQDVSIPINGIEVY